MSSVQNQQEGKQNNFKDVEHVFPVSVSSPKKSSEDALEKIQKLIILRNRKFLKYFLEASR